jgi:hypothetical protein
VLHLDARSRFEVLAIRCEMLPLPVEPYDSFEGFALAYATSSAALRAGTDGCTSTRTVAVPISTTGAKSRTGS